MMQGMNWRANTKLTLLLAVTLTVGLGATACGKRPAPVSTPTPASSHSAGLNNVKAEYTKALSEAKGWQSNATLARVYREYKGTLTPSKPTPLIFSFASLADPTQSFLVELTDRDQKAHKVSRQSFELMFNPINAAEWQIDPDRALVIAEDDGGKRFREEHLAGYSLLQQLSQVGSYPLQWYFRYDTGDGSRKRLEIRLNAKTGALDTKLEKNV